MSITLLLIIIFLVALGLEWRYRPRSLRILTALFAAAVWFFSQPNAHRAARVAVDLPRTEWTGQVPGGRRLSEYQVGVLTMQQVAFEDAEAGAAERLLGIAVLLWLACVPAFRREKGEADNQVSS